MIPINDNDKAMEYINTLSNVKPNRRTGSPGNKKAINYFKNILSQFGFIIDTTPFNSLDYITKKIILKTRNKTFNVHISPYSLPCNTTSNLEIITTIRELEACNCSRKILLLKDEICNEQLMPKNFIFYNPDHHKKIISLLETKKPDAIITATSKNPQLVGALYPYPLIEDGDFNIPNVYCTETVGHEIESYKDEMFTLTLHAKRIPTTASNVIGIKNPEANEKIVICAHIDAYGFSPGASDNASGTTVLLLLAELLQTYNGPYGIEIIAFNGEDHYSVGGQMDYLRRYANQINNITLAINIDDVGYKNGKIAYSLYGCPDDLTKKAHDVFNKYDTIVEGDQWYQGDHMIFVQNEKPTIAITSEKINELMETITHTKNDIPNILDSNKIVDLSKAVYEFICHLK